MTPIAQKVTLKIRTLGPICFLASWQVLDLNDHKIILISKCFNTHKMMNEILKGSEHSEVILTPLLSESDSVLN